MRFLSTALKDVFIIEPQVFGDSRGFFMETWQAQKFYAAGIDLAFVQDNHSKSHQGTLRGLHYQIQQPQGKLIRVIVGEIFDVAVDLRRSSLTFGKWLGVTLSAQNRRMLWVPPGFAHGFYVLSDTAEAVYKCTNYYAPQFERILRWDDLDLAISWPLIKGAPIILSAKDAEGMYFKNAELYA